MNQVKKYLLNDPKIDPEEAHRTIESMRRYYTSKMEEFTIYRQKIEET